MKKGDFVTVKYPFHEAYPDVYEVLEVRGDVCVICEDRDFNIKFLEKVDA